MRNLKKILAMVLALVMSLSLMATAGAADFPDVKDDTSFKTAIDVLSGLGVFNGYKEDGTFRPDGEITRAETAAIIYRIVTGDVKDEQVKIYSDYGLFKDVPANSWFAGYVNFCANAEYIKGDGKGNFNPNDKVEGYAALAMILRAIGYTANGGFTGSDWRVQTARVGEARKITKNITSGTLGSNADRKTVAEILYQAIMVDMVDHNVDNTFNGNQGYTTVPLTLGQKTFGLEYVSGVILANEWANLVGDEVLAADTTKMQITTTYATQSKIAKDATLTLNDKTELEMQEALDAVGLTYNAHIANPTATTADVITLDKSDINVVAYNEGKGVYEAAKHGNLTNATWPTIEKLAEEEGLKLGETDETEYFVNYAQEWDDNCTSEYRISYAIAEESLTGLASVTTGETGSIKWIDYMTELKDKTQNGAIPAPTGSKYEGHYFGERTIKIDLDLDGNTDDANESIKCYVVAIIPGKTINQVDLDIMKNIFYSADRIGTNGNTAEWLQNYAVGEVYVGTTSMKDYSDTMSWPAFKAEYFTQDVNSRRFIDCEIGNSLRVIDNNGDGVAEYVLRIDYTQDKIIGTVKSQPAGYSVAIGNFEGNLLYNPQADEITQDTVINYVEIDKKLYVWPAPVVTDSITNKNFQNITVTASNGETYNQSGIKNETRMDENIMLMNQNTQYNMYMDVYGNNIRSYELAQGSKYALLTEMYPTTDRNGNHVYDYGAIAEVKIADADVTEYPVNVNNNPFFNPYIWTWGLRGYFGAGAVNTPSIGTISGIYNPNYLQPAVAHLNIAASKAANAVNVGYTNNQEDYKLADWYRAVADMQKYTGAAKKPGAGGDYGVFDYGPVNYVADAATGQLAVNEEKSFSFTNVATYIDNDGTLTLGTASKLSTDRATGSQYYRVGSAATAAALPATVAGVAQEYIDRLNLHGIGTEAQLLEAYNKAHGITDTANTQAKEWFNTYIGLNVTGTSISGAYRDGTGIYPVYANDYIHLDLSYNDIGDTKLDNDYLTVRAGIRHFHIDSEYDTLYNTNSNNYVDATVDTEFYIVTPGNAKSIMYKVGYADLPSIKVGEIRAAYAVAHNTRADKDGQDYWVADVIVIETSRLTYDYDSISLVYYNPYEQTGFIRYADTLNNEWKNLQPDYEGIAKMGITPKSGNFSGINWGNVSWSTSNPANYGFWKLYQTELTAPGQLSVTNAENIEKDYNKNHIYAGIATRIEGLQRSEYIDVNIENTGCVQTRAIDVHYGEAGNEIPFYRIIKTNQAYGNIYTAVQLNQNQTLRYSDVKDNDELIWVYDQSGKNISFVIDLGSRSKNAGDDVDYNAATDVPWLWALYSSIVREETTGAPATTANVTVTTAGLTAGATAPVAAGKTYKADLATGTVSIPESDFAVPGYTVAVTAPLTPAGITVSKVGTQYVATDITADCVLTATYTAATQSLNITVTNGGTLAANTDVSYKFARMNTPAAFGGTAITSYTSTDTGTPTVNLAAGDAFTLTFTPDPLYTYTYTVTDVNGTSAARPVSVNDAGTLATIDGTIRNATTIAITGTKGNVAVINVTDNTTDGTITYTTPAGFTDGDEVLASEGLSFKVTSWGTDNLPGTVTWQVIGAAPVVIHPDAQSNYVVPEAAFTAAAAANADIEVVITPVSNAAVETTLATTATGTTEYSLDGGTTWAAVAAGDVSVVPDKGIIFRSDKEIVVTAAATNPGGGASADDTANAAAVVIDPVAGGFRVTVNNIKAGTNGITLTVADKPLVP